VNFRQTRFLQPFFTIVALAIGSSSLSIGGSSDDPVVARVGSATITKKEMERRLAEIPRVQLSRFGKTDDEIRKRFLDEVLVPEFLIELEAKETKAIERPEIHQTVRDIYRQAMLRNIRQELIKGNGIPESEVSKYYSENIKRFQTPERIRIWRIRVGTKEKAQSLIDTLKKETNDKLWLQIARKDSSDKATNQRGGDLGLIAEDGSSHLPNVKADPALFAIAKSLKNGEMAPHPVAEGKEFAIVWRRGSTPAVNRTLEQEATNIRRMLAKRYMAEKLKSTLAKLRKELVKDLVEERVDYLVINPNMTMTTQKHPGVNHPKATGKPKPDPKTLR
jgi:peptidyl-prolyl cis-trans isomerase C